MSKECIVCSRDWAVTYVMCEGRIRISWSLENQNKSGLSVEPCEQARTADRRKECFILLPPYSQQFQTTTSEHNNAPSGALPPSVLNTRHAIFELVQGKGRNNCVLWAQGGRENAENDAELAWRHTKHNPEVPQLTKPRESDQPRLALECSCLLELKQHQRLQRHFWSGKLFGSVMCSVSSLAPQWQTRRKQDTAKRRRFIHLPQQKQRNYFSRGDASSTEEGDTRRKDERKKNKTAD